MNSKVWILTKIFIKNSSQPLLKSKKRKVLPQFVGVALILALLLSSIGIPFGIFIGESYEAMESIGQQGIILGFALAIISIAIFMFGILYVLTVFYFGKDIEFLLPLPLKSSQILGAKFITVLIYEYLTELVFLVPVLVVYGSKSNANPMYYLYSLIIFLILPIIPLVIGAIIDMIVMRFTNIGKHKDALKVIGGLLALFVGIGFNIIVQKNVARNGSEAELLKTLMEGNNSLVAMTTKVFPSAKLASWALIDAANSRGFLNLLLFIVITGAFVLIFALLADLLYFKGVVGASETYSKRKKIIGDELDKGLRQNSAIRTYTIKELRLLFRTPAYLMNCVIMNFLWPVFLLIPLFSQPEMLKNIIKLGAHTNNESVYGIVIIAALCASLFICGSNGITATAISREGQNLYVSKYLPMRYKDQIIAKVLSGIILSGAGIALNLILVIVLLKLPFHIIFLAIISALLGIIFSSFSGILIDLNFPKINWDNEQKAVKQNLNLMINMFLNLILAFACGFGLFNINLSIWGTFGVIALVFGGINILLYYVIGKFGEKLYKKIQV